MGSQTAIVAICFGLLGPFQSVIVCPEIKQKQPQDRKTLFETLSLPVAKILSPVARQVPTKYLCNVADMWAKACTEREIVTAVTVAELFVAS